MRRMEEREEMREEKEKSCPLVKECGWFREGSHVRSWVQMHSRRAGLYMAKQGWHMTSANMKGKTDEERTRYVNR